MIRSKLEMYVDILSVLADRGPLILTHAMYEANINRAVLSGYMHFLVKQGLAEEGIDQKTRRVYAITQRGERALTHFRQLRQALSIEEEGKVEAMLF